VGELLPDAVLRHDELILTQVGDEPPVAVAHARRHRHQIRLDAHYLVVAVDGGRSRRSVLRERSRREGEQEAQDKQRL
jgi:hypothetical protein